MKLLVLSVGYLVLKLLFVEQPHVRHRKSRCAGPFVFVFRHQWDGTPYFEKLAAESTEGTTLADLFYCWSCSTCIFPCASINAVEWRRILGLSCVPSNAGFWALREFKLETREDSAMIEV